MYDNCETQYPPVHLPFTFQNKTYSIKQKIRIQKKKRKGKERKFQKIFMTTMKRHILEKRSYLFIATIFLFIQLIIFYYFFIIFYKNRETTTTTTATTPNVQQQQLTMNAENNNLYTSSNSNKNVMTPIFILGLPRSGSLALHNYFTCHGQLKSVHYCCDDDDDEHDDKNDDGKKSRRTSFPCRSMKQTCGRCILDNIQQEYQQQQRQSNDGETVVKKNAIPQLNFKKCHNSAQVWSQFDVETMDGWFLPQHFMLGNIHNEYPNATWILNRRQTSELWAQSIYHWNSMTRRFLTTYQVPLYPTTTISSPTMMNPPDPSAKVTPQQVEEDIVRSLDQHVYNRTEQLRKFYLLKQIYDNHTATVRHWASQRRYFTSSSATASSSTPSFFEINVDEDKSVILQRLDEFFGYQSVGTPCNNVWNFESPNDDWKDMFLFQKNDVPMKMKMD